MKKALPAGKQPLGGTLSTENQPHKNTSTVLLTSAKPEKICKECGSLFIPKKCTSDYCSKLCYHRNYQRSYYKKHFSVQASMRKTRKVRKPISQQQPAKQGLSIAQESQPSIHVKKEPIAYSCVPSLMPDASDDLISVKEAARRLKCCKQTIYNLIKADKIRLIHFTNRLSFIRWSEILTYNEGASIQQLPVMSEPTLAMIPRQSDCVQPIPSTQTDISDPEWCTTEYAMQHFNFKSTASFYVFVSKWKIRRTKKGVFREYNVADIKTATSKLSKSRRSDQPLDSDDFKNV